MNTKLLEITRRQAISLYNEGKVIYIVTNDQKPETGFNSFTMRKDCKDANLNYYTPGINHINVPLEEYIKFVERNQAEPVYFYTLNSEELFILPYVQEKTSEIKDIEKFKIYLNSQENLTLNATKFCDDRGIKYADSKEVKYQATRLKTLLDVCDVLGIDRTKYNWVFSI